VRKGCYPIISLLLFLSFSPFAAAYDLQCASRFTQWISSPRRIAKPKPKEQTDPELETRRRTYLETLKLPRTDQERLFFLIPSFKELNNGSLARNLLSLLHQDIHLSHLEVDIVVNNSPESAVDQDEAYLENQAMLAVIHYLEDTAPFPDLPDLPLWQRQVFELVKEKKLRVRHRDWSTAGVERNIGVFREETRKLASVEYEESGKDGVAWIMDCDTQIPPEAAGQVLAAFAVEDIESAFTNIKFIQGQPMSSRSLSTVHRWEYEFIVQRLEAFYSSGMEFHLGGPQIISRLSTLKRKGGIPKLKIGEDLTLARTLAYETKFRYFPDLAVGTSDRARPESYLGANRFDNIRQEETEFYDLTNPAFDLLRSEIENIYQTPSEVGLVDRLQGAFDFYGFKFDRRCWEKSENRRHSGVPSAKLDQYFNNRCAYSWNNRGNRKLVSQDYLTGFQALLNRHIEGAEWKVFEKIDQEESTKENAERLALQRSLFEIAQIYLKGESPYLALSPAEVSRLEWLFPFSEEAARSTRGVLFEEVVKVVQTFKEFFSPLEFTNFRWRGVRLGSYLRFLQVVMNSPKQFPKTTALLERLSSAPTFQRPALGHSEEAR
jgi:hypothetical protein